MMPFKEDDVLRRYRLTSPTGDVSEAVILYDNATTGILVATNRSGEWQIDDTIQPADLIMPAYNLDEWDVERLQ
jgi:hypothetical protein